jgi:hypothetical protein
MPAPPEPMSSPPIRWPQSFASPVLESVRPVIERSRDVRTNAEKIAEHAEWMACEELPLPEFVLPFGIGQDPVQAADFILVSNLINFAFTDFERNIKFQVEYGGRHWSDSEAMFACLKRALDEGTPALEGGYLRRVTRADLAHIFRGNIEMPMLDERVEILNAAGEVLEKKYGGRFHCFLESCPPRAYADGRGLLERVVDEFPRYRDISPYHGHDVKVFKLAQLGLWVLHAALSRSGAFRLEDLGRLTAFADYIVPVALRVMRILEYSTVLEETIQQHRLIPRDSPQEVEIRAHTIYATALLCEEINRRRPPDMQVVMPQVDARLWTHFHTTHWPHHLTRTIMY